MARGHIITDKMGLVIAAHVWGGQETPGVIPIEPPAQGMVVECDQETAHMIMEILQGGQIMRLNDGELRVAGTLIGIVSPDKFEPVQ